MQTTHTKNMVYSGSKKVDNGYLRPLLLDLVSSGSGTVTAWDGTGSKPSITGPGLLLGKSGSIVDGELWKKTTSATNNTDWVVM